MVDNDSEIERLAKEIGNRLDRNDMPVRHGYLIRRHGLYTWGRDLDEAYRHIEILEFLFEVLGRSLSMPNFTPSGLRPL